MTEPDRRQQILDAALRVFAREGFHKATIKQIAREAELKSPALIYWYFPNKEELLQAVVTQLSPLVREIQDTSVLMELPPEMLFRMFAKFFFESLTHPQAAQMFRLAITEVVRKPELAEQFANFAPVKVMKFLVAYLQHQIELGTLRPHDPQVATRVFMGSLIIYVLAREILPPLSEGLPDIERYADEAVAIFLGGLRKE